MALKVWMYDKLVDEKEAKISVFDHALLYGDGVFEGIRVYGGKIFEFGAHLDRLYNSAKVIRLDIPMDKNALADAVNKTIEANNVVDGYIRLIVTRGTGDLGLDPLICKEAGIVIIADNIQLYPEQLYETGLKVVSAATIRNHPLSLPPQIKSLNYLNNILAKKKRRHLHPADSGRLTPGHHTGTRDPAGQKRKLRGRREESYAVRFVCL